jgi:hypothetical protein
MGKVVPLKGTFLEISDEIIIQFPCVERHSELIIKIFADFDRLYLICQQFME